MAPAIRILTLCLVLFALAACGGKIRRDFSGGGVESQVMILQDRAAVELSIWEGAIVFDLRDDDDWTQGHIPGARLSNTDDLQRGRGLPKDKDAPVLFMGDGPMDSRPETAAGIALELGYTDVQLYAGGWRNWIGAHPVRD